jgi:hypothetical protein
MIWEASWIGSRVGEESRTSRMRRAARRASWRHGAPPRPSREAKKERKLEGVGGGRMGVSRADVAG